MIQNLAVATIAFAATMVSGTALAETTLPPVEVTGSTPTLCYGMDCQWYFDNWDMYNTEIDYMYGGAGGTSQPKQVAHETDPKNTCGTMEELRLAAANKIAVNYVRVARRGDTIRITLADGKSDVWEYITGGSTPMTGTVINSSPKSSECN